MTPWTAAHQAPLSMGFSRQEYWSGLPFPSPGDLSNPRIETMSLKSPANESESHSVVSNSLQPHGLCPWTSPGQNTGVGGLSFLQGIFPTQESSSGILHCRQILNQLSYQGSPQVESTNLLSALDKLALANLHSKYQYYQQSICLKVKIRLRLSRFRTCSHLTSSWISSRIFSHLNFHFPWVQNLSFRIWGLNKVVPYNSACHTTCHIKFSW